MGKGIQPYIYIGERSVSGANCLKSVYVYFKREGEAEVHAYGTDSNGKLCQTRNTPKDPVYLLEGDKVKILCSDKALKPAPSAEDKRFQEQVVTDPAGWDPYIVVDEYDWPGHAWYNPTGSSVFDPHQVGGTEKMAVLEANWYFVEKGAMADYIAFCKALFKSMKVGVGIVGLGKDAFETASEPILKKIGWDFAKDFVWEIGKEILTGDQDGVDGRFALKEFAAAAVGAVVKAVLDEFAPSGTTADGLFDQAADAMKDVPADFTKDNLEKFLTTSSQKRLKKIEPAFHGGNLSGIALLDRYWGTLEAAIYVGAYRQRPPHVIYANGGPRTLPKAGTRLAPLGLPYRIVGG